MKELASAHWKSPDAAAITLGPCAAWNGLALDPHQTWAFRRAELTCFSESPFFCPNGKRATMAHIRTLPPQASGEERLVAIARRLCAQLMPSLSNLPQGTRASLVLALGERFEEGNARERFRAQRRAIEAAFQDALRPLNLELAVRVEARGHAGLAYGLVDAVPALLARKVEVVLAGGLDTAYDAEVVELLVEQGRLFDGENLDSSIPGEGGALCLFTTPEVARRAGWERQVRLEGVAVANEPAPQSSELPSLAQGRTRVMNDLAEQLRQSRRNADWWVGDLTSERYRTDEWLLAIPRATGDVSNERSVFDILPVLLGDLGSATLPTGIALAAEGFRRGDPAASTCIISASSHGPERGALLLTQPPLG